MSGDRKIILHAGLPKTGTSTVQNLLHANREFLLQQEGVLYPSLAPNLSIPLRTIFRDFQNDSRKPIASRMAGFSIEEEMKQGDSYLNSLDTEVSSQEWSTLLLSAEGISNMVSPELEKMREWGERYASDWTVLVCVRHPVDWSRSVMQQSLKQGDTLEKLYETPPTPKYRQRISNAISVFGRENVRVFDFESASRGEGGIVSAFATQAGLTATSGDFLASRAVRANDSLSLEAARILDSLNRQRPLFAGNVMAPRRPGPGDELTYISRIEGWKFDVPEPVKENIRLQSREDVAWLNETFGLSLYRDVVDPASQAPYASDSQSHEETVGALSDPAIDSIAEVFGELVAANVFRRALDGGRGALGRGDLERAEKMLRNAARLNPDAPQPKKLLKEVAAQQRASKEDLVSQEKSDRRAKFASFWSRLRR